MSSIFTIAKIVLGLLATLISLVDATPGSTGPEKKAHVLLMVDQLVLQLPLVGVVGTLVRGAVTVLLPILIDMLVAHGNATGSLGKPPPTIPLS